MYMTVSRGPMTSTSFGFFRVHATHLPPSAKSSQTAPKSFLLHEGLAPVSNRVLPSDRWHTYALPSLPYTRAKLLPTTVLECGGLHVRLAWATDAVRSES